MKKIVLVAALFIASALQHSRAQEGTRAYPLPPLLTFYYNIKNALVAGDASTAAVNARAFVKAANTIDYKLLSEGNIRVLAADAGRIADAAELGGQRGAFAALSSNMAAVVQVLKLTDEPVYQLYCPMKKAYWLSSDKEVRNPYYGSSMLTCGTVTATYR